MRLILCLIATILVVGSLPGKAQGPAVNNTPPLPRMADRHPDLNGVWSGRGHADLSGGVPGGLPLTPAGKSALASVATQYDPTGFCLYPGVTRITQSPYPIEIVARPGRVAVLYEYMRTFRVIPTDDRKHSADPEPTFFGESVGRWDGDTLVADVVAMNDKSWLDAAGTPHSDALHLTERYRLTDAQHLEYEVTIEDPKQAQKKIVGDNGACAARKKGDLPDRACE